MRKGVLGVALLLSATVAQAQLRRIPADVAPVLEADGVHAGDVIRGALTVSLPPGFHVQSNKPRDPSLIATELTIDAPDGVSVKEVVFPTPGNLKLQGADQPLAVFAERFAIGVQFALAPGISQGPIKVPARLRYQACNDKACFPPKTVEISVPYSVQ